MDSGDDPPGPGDSVLEVVRRFALKSAAWLAIYMIGYYDFSFAWLITPLLLSVLRQQWKKERDFKLSAARHAALTNEKEMIESRIRVEDLPSWVFFPDKERAEWINSILQQLWPNVGHYTRKVITESVEPSVRTALEGYGLAGFRFEKIVLGQIPPRVTGIKVYDKNVGRNEIIMDVDLIHASDCDIKFSVKRFKAKISDFSLRGLVRIVFKPLVTQIPLIGGIQVYFLTSPEIDFDLGGIANALDAPGLSSIIRKIILEQIGHFIVLPNKFTMTLVDTVTNQDLKCPDSAGVLRVCLVRAEKLMKKDIGVLGMGKSDPYAILRVGAKRVETPMLKNTVNPEYNFYADFPIEVVKGQQLSLEFMDHDDPGEDEFLGRATIQTSVVASKGQIENMWIELEDVPTGRALLHLYWLEAVSNCEVLEQWKGQQQQDQAASAGLAKCILHVYVDSCKGLVGSKRQGTSKPSPVVELKVSGQEVQQTWPQYFDCDPVYEQGFVFLVTNPDSNDLNIRVLDTANKNAELGNLVIRMSDMMNRPNMEFVHQPFTLKGQAHSTITLRAQLKCLKKSAVKTGKDNELAKRKVDAAQYDQQKQQQQQPPPPLYEDLVEEPMAVSSVAARQSCAAVPVPSAVDKTDVAPAAVDVMADVAQDISLGRDPGPGDGQKVSIPPLDEMVANTVEPILKASGNQMDMSELMNPLAQLRQRRGSCGVCGKINLALSYDSKKEELVVMVIEAKGLPGGHLPDPPDPYVKLYLLPERSKRSKRKSDAKKDTVNPVYNDKFEYHISRDKIGVQKLEVSVVDKKGIFARRALMGRVVLDLGDSSLLDSQAKWYLLEEADDDSD